MLINMEVVEGREINRGNGRKSNKQGGSGMRRLSNYSISCLYSFKWGRGFTFFEGAFALGIIGGNSCQ